MACRRCRCGRRCKPTAVSSTRNATPREWKAAFARFLDVERKELIDSIENDKKWDEDVESKVKEAVEAFNQQYGVEG